MTRPGSRRFLRDFTRALSWHRRKLAVLAALGAVLTGIAAVAPEGPPTVEVVRATRFLAGGSTLTVDAVELRAVPEGAPSNRGHQPSLRAGRTLRAG